MIFSESSSLAADFWIRTRAEAVRQLHAKLQLHGRVRHTQRLQIGVGDDELDALDAGINHAVDCVAAATTDSDDLNLGVVAGFFVKADANAGIVCHCVHLFIFSIRSGVSFKKFGKGTTLVVPIGAT